MPNHKTESKTKRELKIRQRFKYWINKRIKKCVFEIIVSIDNGKDFKIEPVDSIFRNGIMIYCH